VLGGKPGEYGDCASNMEQVQIAATAARRFPVVDENAGVVLGMVIFIRPSFLAKAVRRAFGYAHYLVHLGFLCAECSKF
jgi:hypothetical protein